MNHHLQTAPTLYSTALTVEAIVVARGAILVNARHCLLLHSVGPGMYLWVCLSVTLFKLN